ncbi:MAG: hypothetical protein KZQ77_17885 [Candidatus Thiodiazotropha sp. (ex Notomyrtea botanica)]|nr:hypothetical protein [Candidatus Thiodiazotropha sp. (ex Notomyrtea botanica)]
MRLERKISRFLDFGPFKDAANKLRNENEKVYNRLELLRRRRDELHALPATKEDIKNELSAWVDKMSEEYRGRMSKRLQMYADKPMNIKNISELPTVDRLAPRLLGIDHRDLTEPDQTEPGALALLFSDLIKDALCKEVDRLELGKPGPSYTERVKEVAEIDEEITDLTESMKLMRSAAQQAGIAFKSHEYFHPKD